MKDEIIKIAKENGISAVGVLKARVFDEIREKLRPDTPMVSQDTEERVNPFLIMPDAKSIIVCLFSYNNSAKEGNISLYAMGGDYHKTVLKRLSAIQAFIEEKGYKAKCLLDTGKLPERQIAYLAGLGFIGKNSCLINEEFGSFCFIGYILTDLHLTPDTPSDKTCMNCGKCVSACPGGAIGENGINPHLCASYITQKKGELSKNEEEIIRKSGYAWGCDICQLVCPHNENVPKTPLPEFCENLITNLTPDMASSNRDFRKKYGNRAFSWRGFDVIKRNLKILKEE